MGTILLIINNHPLFHVSGIILTNCKITKKKKKPKEKHNIIVSNYLSNFEPLPFLFLLDVNHPQGFDKSHIIVMRKNALE